MLKFGSGPGEYIDDEAVTNLLQTIHASTDGAGPNQDIYITFKETIQTRLVFAGIESDLPTIFCQCVTQQMVYALYVMSVN